jgi:hypothetical protein
MIVCWTINIFRHATSRSLCLLDEFGKGTLTEGEITQVSFFSLPEHGTWLYALFCLLFSNTNFVFLSLCRWHWSARRDYQSFCELWLPPKGQAWPSSLPGCHTWKLQLPAKKTFGNYNYVFMILINLDLKSFFHCQQPLFECLWQNGYPY